MLEFRFFKSNAKLINISIKIQFIGSEISLNYNLFISISTLNKVFGGLFCVNS